MVTFFKNRPWRHTCDHFIPAKLPLMTRCDLIPQFAHSWKKQQLGQQQRKNNHNEMKPIASSNRVRIEFESSASFFFKTTKNLYRRLDFIKPKTIHKVEVFELVMDWFLTDYDFSVLGTYNREMGWTQIYQVDFPPIFCHFWMIFRQNW